MCVFFVTARKLNCRGFNARKEDAGSMRGESLFCIYFSRRFVDFLDVCIFWGRWVYDDDGGKRIDSFSVEGGRGGEERK